MKICIPTHDDSGLDAALYDHFGSAPFFTLVDVDSARIEVIDNSDSGHQHGQCTPTGHLEGKQVDAVVCRGMGRRAVSRLLASGIDVLVADGRTVGETVTAARENRLRHMAERDACGGGGQGHCHQHGPGHGHGGA